MSDWVKIRGSGEGDLWLARVPCVGEYVTVNGCERRVARVELHPLPYPFTLSAGWQPAGTLIGAGTLDGPMPAATVYVEDE